MYGTMVCVTGYDAVVCLSCGLEWLKMSEDSVGAGDGSGDNGGRGTGGVYSVAV